MMSKQNTSPPRNKYADHQRKITFDGRTVISHGNKRWAWEDFYHVGLSISWKRFFGFAALFFLLVNTLFAVLFNLQADGVANLYPQNFWGAFFFSVETLGTVGYGDMHPATVYTHIVATIEIFVGMASAAVLTGLIFARFSKPKARIIFALNPVVTMFNGQRALMVRVANARQNFVVNVHAKINALIPDTTQEGATMRRIYNLNLVRDEQPMFILGWSIIHIIDEDSPLANYTEAQMSQLDLMLIVQLDGYDESTAQNIQARHSYTQDTLLWDHRYVDAIYADEDGITHIDYNKFHQTTPIESAMDTSAS